MFVPTSVIVDGARATITGLVKPKKEGNTRGISPVGVAVAAMGTALPIVGAVTIVATGYRWYRKWRNTLSVGTSNVVSALNDIDNHVEDDAEAEEQEEAEMLLVDSVLSELPATPNTDLPPVPKTRGRKKSELVFEGGRITGVMSVIAQKAKIRFGTVGYTQYNRNAVRRWVLHEAAKCTNMRSKDLLRALPLVELYVFYKTDEDIEVERAVEELTTSGRIRQGMM